MRKINKLVPLPNFNGNNYNTDCKIWSCKKCTEITFHNKYKNTYEDARWQILIDEQNQLCGYTELYIENLEESHIDHYKKREHFPHLTFDWNNLIVATKDNDFGANYKDSKIKISEYNLIFNPITENVENDFYYDEFGMIREDKGKVEKTIEVFNLNHPFLKFKRKQLIDMIESLKSNGLSKNEIKTVLEPYGLLSVLNQYS